jgi:hypothetical protein
VHNVLTIEQHKDGKEGSKVSRTNFVRLEAGGAAVDRSVGTVRAVIRAGEVPAIRNGKVILVDLEALKERFAARPVAPGRPGSPSNP